MSGRNGRRVCATVGVIAAVGCASAAQAAPAAMVTEQCDEHQAFVEGDDAAVAARLPKRYAAVRARGSGAPLLFVRAIRCRAITIDDETAPGTMASYGVVIQSPDGRGCASGAPGIGSAKGDVPDACNWYVLSWLADDRRIVRWLRHRTPGFPVEHSDRLAFRTGPFDPNIGGAPFAFAADGFGIEATTRERPGEIAVRGGYWRDTPQGSVKVAFSTEDITSGDADGRVTAAAGTELAALLGAPERPYVPGYSSFAAERWERGVYRKQVVEPEGAGFAGSCAVKGDVRFKPPATTTEAALEYTYDAEGTCSGTLDGREVSEAPVTIHTGGRSYGSCNRAQTTSPGQATIAFASGEVVRYTFDFVSTSTEIDFEVYGERSGTGNGHGTFLTERTSPDVAAQCRGEGVSQIPMDMTLETESPLVNDRPEQRGGSPSGGGRGGEPSGPRRAAARRRALRLLVSPGAVNAGRRKTLVFRVTTADGAPVRGAVVRFAGRRARTGAAGTARIRMVVRRAGLRRARATKPGFRAARAAIVVRTRASPSAARVPSAAL